MENMKRIKIVGLCLVAVFAFSALAAASASAETQPEFKVCAKAAKETVEWKEGAPPKEKTKKKSVYTGEWGNKTCTEPVTTDVYRSKGSNPGPEGKYAETEVPTPDAFTYKSKGSTFYYYNAEPKIVWKVVCKKDKVVGNITSPTEFSYTITWEGCTAYKEGTLTKYACENIKAIEPFDSLAETYPGEEAGFVNIGYAESFKCGSVEFTAMNGLVVGKVQTGSKGPEAILAASATTGEQDLTGVRFAGEIYESVHLESVVGGEDLRVGVTTTEGIGPKGVVVVG